MMRGPLTTRSFILIIFSIGVMALLFAGGGSKKESKVETREALPSGGGNSTSAADLLAQSAPINPPIEEEGIILNAAGAYLLESGETLYAFRDEKRWPIASVTKLMTSLVARRLMSGAEIVAINEEAVAASGEVGDFRVGERFMVDDLVKAMLLASSNDAARAVTTHYGREEFVAEMNRLALVIGMTETTFVDPAGLSMRNLSTARDLNKLVQFIWHQDPEIFAITRLPRVTIIDIDTERKRKLDNINFFVGRKNFLGGKTGQIPDSGGNLISVFSLPYQNSPVVVIVLGAKDRFGETEKILMKL